MKALIVLVFCTMLFTACDKRAYNELDLYDKNGDFNVVIEAEAGKVRDVEYKPELFQFTSPTKDGKELTLDFFAYPFNTGFFPSTYVKDSNGKESQIDCIVFGDNLSFSTLIGTKPFGMVEIGDSISTKHYIVLTMPTIREYLRFYPKTLSEFETKYPVLKEMLILWLENFNGQNWKVRGWKNEKEASEFIKKHYRKTV